jgi:putative protease
MAELRSAEKKPPPFKEGIFFQAASIEDLYVVQSDRPAGVILPLNKKNARSLLDEKPLPFKPDEIILALDPWFEEDDEDFLAQLPDELKEHGYSCYILNNPGHFSLFRTTAQTTGKDKKKTTQLIAGPWLYTFNSWAASFAVLQGASGFVMPLENNRQNLEKTMPLPARRQVFITLFAWPPLFRIKTQRKLYGFKHFSDSRAESFSVINGEQNAVVIPDTPFCITDKKPFLTEAGFRRFIVDFSGGTFNGSFPLKKKLYKEVMKAAKEGLALSGISRFNWKNGFYQPSST